MSQPQVSVIVPIYNVEEYLDHCLSTIEKQTFRDFEVLLINDGTPDNSMDIAKRYAEKDKRFLSNLSNAHGYNQLMNHADNIADSKDELASIGVTEDYGLF